jgi:hypothetical protein
MPLIVASHDATLAIAESDRPVRVLGYQGLIQSVSNVQPVVALTLSIDVTCIRDAHFAPAENPKIRRALVSRHLRVADLNRSSVTDATQLNII